MVKGLGGVHGWRVVHVLGSHKLEHGARQYTSSKALSFQLASIDRKRSLVVYAES